MNNLRTISAQIKQCTLCKDHLPFAPQPLFQVSSTSKILIIGQAPSLTVQKTGILWNDESGKRLTDWLGITIETLHDKSKISILPMGFCYPGKNKTGDLPPRKECALTWHPSLLSYLDVELMLLVGSYAQNYYLRENKKSTLTETVKAWKQYRPLFIPLPHPSPLNNLWLKKNPWFEKNNLPALQTIVANILSKK